MEYEKMFEQLKLDARLVEIGKATVEFFKINEIECSDTVVMGDLDGNFELESIKELLDWYATTIIGG